jgi:hypothetical protein
VNTTIEIPSARLPQQETAGPCTSTDLGTEASALSPQQETAGPSTSTLLYAVDPGQREGATILHPSGRTSIREFQEFVQTLKPGTIVATESTVHAYRPKDRRELIEAADARGVEMWAMRSLFTSRARKELGIEKSDANDARAILHYFQTRRNLFYRLRPSPRRLGTVNEAGTPRFEANAQLVALRREGYADHRGKHLVATISVLAEVALKFGLSMRSFNVLCGFFGTGYPSLARSNRNKHGAGKKAELRSGKMKEIRREARRYYQVLRASARSPQQETAGPITSTPEEVSA